MTADGESWRTVRHMDNHENIRARIGARLEANARAVLDVPETWIPHLGELDTKLVAINPGYSVAQVKSKFGGLRFYAFPSRDDVTATVDWSATITEAGDNLHIEIPGVGAGSAPTRAAVRTAIATMLSEAGAIGPLRVHLEIRRRGWRPKRLPAVRALACRRRRIRPHQRSRAGVLPVVKVPA